MKYKNWILIALALVTLAPEGHAGMIERDLQLSTTKEEGGVSGGGGEVKQPQPIDIEFIRERLPKVRAAVETYLNFIEFWEFNVNYNNAPDPVLVNVLKDSPTIYEALMPGMVELRLSGPCRDANNQPVDGSVHNVTPPAQICLSAEAFIAKSNDILFFQDAAALVLHEFAHLGGADERAAQRLQRQAYASFGRWVTDGSDSADEDLRFGLEMGMAEYLNQMNLIRDAAGSCVRMKYMNILLEDIRKRTADGISGLYVLRGDDMAHFNAQIRRSSIISDYFCSLDPQESRNTNVSSLRMLDVGFEREASVNLELWTDRINQYLTSIGSDLMYRYERPNTPEIMTRPTSVDNALNELNLIHSYLRYKSYYMITHTKDTLAIYETP